MSIASKVLHRVALVAVLSAALLTGCNKPTDENCRKALANIRRLLGTEHLSQADQTVEGEVRRCRGGSKRASVDCAIKATTLDELRACKLIDIPGAATSPKDPAPVAPTTPATPAAAPAAPGPAPATDSAAPGASKATPAAPPASIAPGEPAPPSAAPTPTK
jgi:hypothetical protein